MDPILSIICPIGWNKKSQSLNSSKWLCNDMQQSYIIYFKYF